MKSNVNIVEHPVHPILVLIPVGASFVLDIVFLGTANTFWFVASLWVMVIGIVGAVLAAITGAYDLFTLPITDEPKKVGLSHMTLNVIVLVLYLINVLAIRAPALTSSFSTEVVSGSTSTWAFIVNLVSVVLLLISGWLGGELIYRYGLAVPKRTMAHASAYERHPARGRTGMAGSLGGERSSEEEE